MPEHPSKYALHGVDTEGRAASRDCPLRAPCMALFATFAFPGSRARVETFPDSVPAMPIDLAQDLQCCRHGSAFPEYKA